MFGGRIYFFFLSLYKPYSFSDCKSRMFIMCACMLSCFSHVRLFVTLWTAARQAPLSMGFSRQEYWRGLPCPPLGDLPEPGMEPVSHMSPAMAGGFFTTSATWGFYGSGTQVV